MPSIPTLNPYSSASVDLDPTPQITLPVMAWMYNAIADDVPEGTAPWLMAQGWQIANIEYDSSTSPPTPSFDFTREAMATSAVLQSLVNIYTAQYNEGRELNAARYNNIVTNWKSLSVATILDLDAAATASNATLGVALTTLDTALAEVDTITASNDTQVQADAADLAQSLTLYLEKLTDVETNLDDAVAALEAIVTEEGTVLSAYTTEHATKLGLLEAELASATTSIEADFTASVAAIAAFVSGTSDPLTGKLSAILTDQQAQRTAIESTLASEASAFAEYLAKYQTETAEAETLVEAFQAQAEAIVTQQATALSSLITDYATAMSQMASDLTSQITDARAIETTATTELTTHVADYQARLSELDTDYGELETAVTSAAGDATAAFDEHASAVTTLLDSILADYTSHATTINGLLSSANTTLSDHDTEYRTALDQLLTDYDTHKLASDALALQGNTDFASHDTEYRSLLAEVLTEWVLHATTATGLLEDLGATELARINEEYDSKVAEVRQATMNQGFYSSPVLNDRVLLVERERSQGITELNDRLAREKLDNTHRLYEQQTGVRTRTAAGYDSLFTFAQAVFQRRFQNEHQTHEQHRAARGRVLEGFDRLHTFSQEVLRYKVQAVSRLQVELQDVRNRTLAGKEASYRLKQATIAFTSEMEFRRYEKQEAVNARVLEGKDRVYQLRKGLRDWLLSDQHILYQQELAVTVREIEEVEKTHAAKQEVYRASFTERDAITNRLMDEIKLALEALDRQRAAGVQYATTEEGIRQRLFAALQATYKGYLDNSDRLATLTIDTYRAEASARETLLGIVTGVRDKVIGDIDRRTAAEQAVQGATFTQRDRLLGQAQDATAKVADGRARGTQLQLQNAEFLSNARTRLAAMTMESSMNAARMAYDKNNQEMSLIRYQVDARNNLIVGLFGFEERRFDLYPSMDVLVKLCSALGDTAATSWVSP